MCAEVRKKKGAGVREIARELGVDESTLRYHLQRRAAGLEDGRKRQAEACEEYADVIGEWLEDNRLLVDEGEREGSVAGLFDTLQKRGYAGSYKSVVRYVRRRVSKPVARPKRRVETRPGAQAQIDWTSCKLNIVELGGLVALSAFIFVLSFSRRWVVVWARKEDQLSWLSCHNQALAVVGGLPLTFRIDNLKTGVAKGTGAWATLNEVYDSYTKQLQVLVNPCRRACGSDKGKVERRAKELKAGVVTPGESFASIRSLQAATNERIAKRARTTICPVTGRSVHDSWCEEQEHLRPVPESLPTPFDLQVTRGVQDDCLINFEGRQYQVPNAFLGRDVQVRGCADTVEIYGGRQLLRSYPRGTECRILLDQALYDAEGNERVSSATPLGKLARDIVLPRSWDWRAPQRDIDVYASLVGRLS